MRHVVIAGILLLLIAISVLYVFWGNNWLTEQQYIQQEKNRDFVRNDLLQRLLEIEDQSEEVINQLINDDWEMELIDQKNISLDLQPMFSVEKKITSDPVFDLKYIYLTLGNVLNVYRKMNNEIEWTYDFESEISELNLLDANRIMVQTKEGKLSCFNRERGKIIWQRTDLRTSKIVNRSDIKSISLNKYHQLESSVVMIINEKSITLLNSISGKVIGNLETENRIEYSSAFDQIERCVYLGSDNKLKRLQFNVNN